MKKPTILITMIVILQLIALMVNVGEVKCQDKGNIANTQYQAEHMAKQSQAITDDNMQDDKNVGVRIIEIIIKQNLNSRYQRLEPEEMMDMLDTRR